MVVVVSDESHTVEIVEQHEVATNKTVGKPDGEYKV
jgi:hypothetical protein